MAWQELSLSDVRRLVAAITQAAGGSATAIRDIINRMPVENMPNGRVTLGMIQRLLEQTGGSTVLPDNIVALLHQPEEQLNYQPVAGGSVTYGLAQEIMGRNFITLASVEEKFGVTFDREQRLGLMAKVPFSAGTLQVCKDTHILFPGYPLSIVEIKQLVKDRQPPFFWKSQAWYDENMFANEPVQPRWHLLKKEPPSETLGPTGAKENVTLGQNEEVPTCEFVYGLVLYALVKNERLFNNKVYASFGGVFIGDFNDSGMGIDHGIRNGCLYGLAVCRRPDC